MRSKLILAAYLTGTMLMTVQLTGCTVVGAIAGSAASKKSMTIEGWEIIELHPGRKVRLELKNDSTIETKYGGTFVYNTRQYTASYTNWLGERPARHGLPQLDDSVAVATVTGEETAGTFCGFDVEHVCVKVNEEYTPIHVRNVRSMSHDQDDVVTGARLAEEIAEGEAPLRRYYWFDEKGERLAIDPRDISEIFVYPENHAATGMLLGLAVDLVVVAALSASGFGDDPLLGDN